MVTEMIAEGKREYKMRGESSTDDGVSRRGKQRTGEDSRGDEK
jgi:hypothetical protein